MFLNNLSTVARNENLFRYLNISIIYIENGISKRGLFFLLQPLNKNKRVEQNVFLLASGNILNLQCSSSLKDPAVFFQTFIRRNI